MSCTAALKGARVALKLGLLERSEALYRLALPEFPAVHADVQRVRELRDEVSKAEALLEGGDPERAAACIAGALKAAPKGLALKLLHVKILLRCKRFQAAQEACEAVRRALANAPNAAALQGPEMEGRLRLLAARALCGAGDLLGAARELLPLLEMEGEWGEGRAELAVVEAMGAAKDKANALFKQGSWALAAHAYAHALTINPVSPPLPLPTNIPSFLPSSLFLPFFSFVFLLLCVCVRWWF